MKARTGITHRSRRALALLAAGVVAAAASTLAVAAPIPAEHFPLAPLGGEPLQEGFVEVIHPNGPQVYTRHVYKLNGARSDQSYQVVISIWASNTNCSGDPQFVIPAAVLSTNAAGNGKADAVFDPDLMTTLGLRDLTTGCIATLLREGSPAYTTGCQAVQHD
jgi:hypothetical protein